MTATKQRAVDMVMGLSDEDVETVISYIVSLEQPKVKAPSARRRLGIANGKYKIPKDINAFDDEVAEMFGVE